MNIYKNILNIIFPNPFSQKDLKSLHKAQQNKEDFIFSLFDYKQDKTKQIIKYLKNNNDIFLKKEIAHLMYEHIIDYVSDQQELSLFKKILIIPVPISKKRLTERGFNQTHIIAKYLAKELNGKYNKKVIRKHSITKKQALIKNRQERFTNVKGVFSVREKNKYSIRNKDIIIIDDLATTGATLLEIKKVLKQNNARNIIALTIAH